MWEDPFKFFHKSPILLAIHHFNLEDNRLPEDDIWFPQALSHRWGRFRQTDSEGSSTNMYCQTDRHFHLCKHLHKVEMSVHSKGVLKCMLQSTKCSILERQDFGLPSLLLEISLGITKHRLFQDRINLFSVTLVLCGCFKRDFSEVFKAISILHYRNHRNRSIQNQGWKRGQSFCSPASWKKSSKQIAYKWNSN